MKTQYCEHCFNGDDDTVFPYYGLAPHKSALDAEAEKAPLPENFTPDEDGIGVYTHCLVCGADGRPIVKTAIEELKQRIEMKKSEGEK